MLRRHTADVDPESDLTPPSRAVFEMIGMAKVATSAAEALEWKYLRPTDTVTMNRDRLLADAKRVAIDLAEAGYHPPADAEILVGGAGVHAAFELGLYMMREGGYASDYDVHVGRKLAGVLSGGKLSQPSYVSEEYLLRLEREAFVSLCGEEKTQQRIESLLKTGRPLRN
jgi:3-hydroxyacyl-CoA dehydrogenase